MTTIADEMERGAAVLHEFKREDEGAEERNGHFSRELSGKLCGIGRRYEEGRWSRDDVQYIYYTCIYINSGP